MLLFTVPKRLVLSRELVQRLFVSRLVVPIWLVWYIRFSHFPHFVNTLHDLVRFGIKKSNSIEGKINMDLETVSAVCFAANLCCLVRVLASS